MIIIHEIESDAPHLKFINYYQKALKENQTNIEAMSISSFSKVNNEVDSRFVNLKYIKKNEWVFFSNYSSKKSQDFEGHNQISIVFFWNAIKTQIRIKANITKLSIDENIRYFRNRDKEKNAVAISSNQSKKIDSYDSVIKNYNNAYNNERLDICPDYWGGYFFVPYYFEFWEGHHSRLNKREAFKKNGKNWDNFFLQP